MEFLKLNNKQESIKYEFIKPGTYFFIGNVKFLCTSDNSWKVVENYNENYNKDYYFLEKEVNFIN
jgi:hypothetical protein